MPVERSVVLLRMKKAQALGQSASAFIRKMDTEGLSYRRTTMLSDWRNVGNIEKKEGAYRYIRKDYRPTQAIAQVKDWKLSREFMHKAQVAQRLRPGEPITTRFINVMADKPLTPRELEQAVLENLPDYKDSIPGIVERVVPWTLIQRVG